MLSPCQGADKKADDTSTAKKDEKKEEKKEPKKFKEQEKDVKAVAVDLEMPRKTVELP